MKSPLNIRLAVSRLWAPWAGLALLAASPAAAATVLPTGFTDSLVVGGLDFPVGMALLPDGRLLVIEQKSAKVRMVVGRALASTDPLLTVPNVNGAGQEQGLLGITVDPQWPSRPYIYVHSDYSGASTIHISRFTGSGALSAPSSGNLSFDPASRYELITDIPDNAPNHNGGTLRFGPDGMLYVSLGEDAQECAAQDTTALRGKILRLDVSRLPASGAGPATRALITPTGNPFAASADLNERLIWELGLRNPFRFHIDSVTGDLFIADVGQSTWEEVNHASMGGLDFGWPWFEGPAAYHTCSSGATTGFTAPIYSWDRSNVGSAAFISGGVYHPVPLSNASFPAAYDGDYFFSDFYSGFVRRLTGSGSSWQLAAPVAGQPNATDWGSGFAGVSDYLVGPDGALWFCSQASNIFAPNPNTGSIHRILNVAVPPSLSSFAPPSGIVGAAVTLTGSALTGATDVSINGTAAIFNVDSDSQISSSVPAGASTGKIGVTTPNGSAQSAADFVVIVAPQILGLAPATGAPGTPVTLTGSGFSGATAVSFNGTSASFTIDSDVQVSTSVPAAATTGKISLTSATGTAQSTHNFTVSATPSVLVFAPPYPSPANGVSHLGWSLPSAAQVELEIFDTGGRRVRQLIEPTTQSAGFHAMTWDGRDDDGHEVRPGLYVVQLRVNGDALEHRISLIR